MEKRTKLFWSPYRHTLPVLLFLQFFGGRVMGEKKVKSYKREP